MKQTKLILILTLLIATATFAQNTPVVSNSRFEQRTDGSLKVDIYYDVNDAYGDAMTVSILVSNDGGTTWNFTATNLTGDIGDDISSGTNKKIVWDFGVEHPNTFSDKFIIEISADDNTGGGPCGSSITYAGKTYNTVQIGDQCWFAENLNIGKRIDGSSNQTQADTDIEKYCYNNLESNCDIYGGLYQWNEAMQYVTTEGTQGICPTGWHIPTYSEMQILETYVEDKATKLIDENAKSGYTYTNETGFSALFAGYRNYIGSFGSLGDFTYFWSSTENGSFAYSMYLYYNNSDVYFTNSLKTHGFSVRCLKD